MDIQDAGGDLVDGVAQAHRLEPRPNQYRRSPADDVRAEQQPCDRIGNLFAKLVVSSSAQP
jgi:hypothetical protein